MIGSSARTERPRRTVSVAVCTYNGEKFVAAQLESIIAQTVKPDEVVVRDDGSTDGTLRIVQEIGASSPVPVRVVGDGRNLGVTRNFVAAIAECGGDVVFLADQDDVWLPGKVERMLAAFDADPLVGLAYCDATIVDAWLAPSGMSVFETRGRSQVWKGSARDPRDVLKRPNVKGCTMAVDRRLLSFALPIPEIAMNPAWTHDYWIAFCMHCLARVVAVDEPLMLYRVHGGNASGLVKASSASSRNRGEPYSSSFASSLLRDRVALYDSLLAFAKRVRDSGFQLLPGAEEPFVKAISEDLSLFRERVRIWETKNLARRVSFVASFLLSGRYARFKRPLIQAAKDAIGLAP